ncbi:uncharacterized protein [Triticum aestivum]|uniref:uncharacterized protein isoform X2 n=1 Tax=Triticum aestivum TaxID=4565 RepID=UPI001D0068C9|nr:uncharacterized protein LOC123093829 isoform X2 [Triticum aestivum]
MGGHAYPNLLPFPTTGPCTGGIATGTVSSSSCRYSVHCRRTSKVVVGRRSAAASVSCSAASAQAPPSQSTIKVVIVGATKKMGRAAVTAVSRARGMVLAGATDTQCIGMDAGQVRACLLTTRSHVLCLCCSSPVVSWYSLEVLCVVSSDKWHGRSSRDPRAQ